MEFKYFETEFGERIISSDIVVGQEEFIRQKIYSSSLPKVNKQKFLNLLDNNGTEVFQKIFEFAEQKGLMIRWGSKGFSLNVELTSGSVGLFYGFPPVLHSIRVFIRYLEILQKRLTIRKILLHLTKKVLKPRLLSRCKIKSKMGDR